MIYKNLKIIIFILILILAAIFSFSCTGGDSETDSKGAHDRYLDAPPKKGMPTVIEFYADW